MCFIYSKYHMLDIQFQLVKMNTVKIHEVNFVTLNLASLKQEEMPNILIISLTLT